MMTLSPHACARCKFSHKKCDRITPICSNCSKRGKECHYEIEHVIPKKRGRKPKDTKTTENSHSFAYQPYPIPKKPISPLIEAKVPTLSAAAIDQRFHDSIILSPLLDRRKAEDIIKFKKNAESGSQDLPVFEKVPSNEDMALFFAFQGM